MPRLPTLKSIPLEGDPISREVRLLAVQGRRHSPALDAFVKVARRRDWSAEVPTGACGTQPARRWRASPHDYDTHAGGQPIPADRSAA
jgi:hypothetical protein